MEDKLFNLLVEQEDITWKDIIYDLVKSEQLDPWDIDISRLTKKYIETIKEIKEADFKLSGKVLLAAALMLNLKGKRLVGEDIDALDRLIAQKDLDEDQFYDELENATYRDPSEIPESERMQLIPRTPQPRLRKVSVYDLVAALEKALEVKKRRLLRELPAAEIFMPNKNRDITLMIKGLYKHILEWFSANPNKRLMFSILTPNATKDDKIFTFIPLLHLTNERKIDLHQQEHFSDFRIHLIDPKKVRGPVQKVEDAAGRADGPADPLKEARDKERAEKKAERDLSRNKREEERKKAKEELKAQKKAARDELRAQRKAAEKEELAQKRAFREAETAQKTDS